jgi:hypothetical protein
MRPHLEYGFSGGDVIEVLLDRRQADRRTRPLPRREERRRRERRAFDPGEELRGFGWALVPTAAFVPRRAEGPGR